MTLANELERAWSTLEAGNSKENLRRSLVDFGVQDSRMMLAIEGGCRELLFPAPENFALDNLKRTRGVSVAVRTYASGTTMNRFLVLRCANPEFHGVFRRFAAAVLEQVSTSTDPSRAALDAIREWHELFNRAGEKGDATLLGIYGELHELRELVKRNRNAVLTWTGPYARPQDFINGRYALEVKTVRTFATEVEIHGIEQLWTHPYERLVLVVKQIVTDPVGQRLADIVSEILSHGVSADALYERCEAFDLDSEQIAALDMPRFLHRGSRYFLVTDSAPCLTPDKLRTSLSPGISRLRYCVPLDAGGFQEMAPQEIDEFIKRLGG